MKELLIVFGVGSVFIGLLLALFVVVTPECALCGDKAWDSIKASDGRYHEGCFYEAKGVLR